MTRIVVDGQEHTIPKQRLSVLVGAGDMEIEAPDNFLIGPEETLELSRTLEPDQWDAIRVHPNFIKAWKELWDVQPPEVLSKASMGVRHTVGMILLLFKCRGDGVSPHLKYPESYLHPSQQARLVQMVFVIYPPEKGKV